jgi:hypothetical protein
MAETTVPNDEIARLNTRIANLEAELSKKKSKQSDDDKDSTTSRLSDSLTDVKDSQLDSVARVCRGLSIAAIEAARLAGTTVSSFAEDVIDRNRKRDDGDRTVRNLIWRLPEDFFSGLSTAIEDFARIPAKTADRYSSAYKEGTKST